MSNAAKTGRTDFGGRRLRVRKKFPKETLTEQNHKAACDVNNIMARYTRTGVMDHIRQFEPVYSDFTPEDYHTSMNVVADAKTMFEELPSTMRRHFGDDVSAFLEFCSNTPDAAAELQGIAEEYRRQALGASGTVEVKETPSSEKGDTGEATAPENQSD